MPRGENVRRDLERLANREKASAAIRAKLESMAETITEQALTIRDFESASRALDPRKVRSAIFGLSEVPADPPDWLVRTKPPKGSPGVPTLFCSDVHAGEVVRAEEINGLNSYDMATCRKRLRLMVDRTIDLLENHLVNPNYPGIVFALGGDMVSGDIHDELKETNELASLPTVLALRDVLVSCIGTLADRFGKVFVPCVVGNHGRQSKKPRAKLRVHTNYDWLLYTLLEKHFEGDPRIRFNIPEGPDARYSVYGHRYLLIHGDRFRGGDGMIGALGPIIRGDHRERSKASQINAQYDTMILGHWHQYISLSKLIVNGSVKGYDEYANNAGFGFEAPKQALWLTHPKHGITISMPVILEDKPIKSREWVTF